MLTGHNREIGYARDRIHPCPHFWSLSGSLGLWPRVGLFAGMPYPMCLFACSKPSHNGAVARTREHHGWQEASRLGTPVCVRRGGLAWINKGEINGRLSETETSQSLMSALFGDTETPGQCLPPVSCSQRPPSSSSMSSVHEPPHNDYLPPLKRPRISNPPPPALPYIPGPPGPSSSTIPDQDGAADAASRKNRKRPLSCGECRR